MISAVCQAGFDCFIADKNSSFIVWPSKQRIGYICMLIRTNHNIDFKESYMKIDLSEIKESVRAYVLEKVYAEKDRVKDDSMIFTEGYIDSMGFMDLVVFLEQEFSIRIGDSDLIEENFESINAISDFVMRKLVN